MLTEELDPGIREVVIALNEAGFKTTASCQGRDGHSFQLPTVNFDPATDTDQLKKWLYKNTENGWTLSDVHYAFSEKRFERMYYQVEWWTSDEVMVK